MFWRCPDCGMSSLPAAKATHVCTEQALIQHATNELADAALAQLIGRWGAEPSAQKRRDFARYLRERESECESST